MNHLEVIKYINSQKKDNEFLLEEIDRLNEYIKELKSLPKGWVMPNSLPIDLGKEEFNIDEINTAYQRTIMYEGLRRHKGGTILNTFLEMLNKSHHSLQKIVD